MKLNKGYRQDEELKGTFAKMRNHLMNIDAGLRAEVAESMQHASGEMKRIIARMMKYRCDE